MNTSHIKSYAPKARQAFIAAVTERANRFGIFADHIESATVSGDLLQVGANHFEATVAERRKRLVERVQLLGFAQVMEQVAYSWFNRLCAIRFMELKDDYLGHGLRVLSHPEKSGGFEVLDHAQDAAAELGLDRDSIIELKLAGNKDEELYRELLLGQCHQLYQAMPFLFEPIDDETELLLPDNLTRTDSLIRALVDDVPETDWDNIEIIGWLYQFYISEKKDQVIGKVVKSEDIPAATQLFTPNWIVKYMVQNSLGAQWLATYPDSPLKGQMAYYIEPAEQSIDVKTQLEAITPSSLNPEALTLIDPACGSGHILVEAYDLFKEIYLERGFRLRDIPQLILEKNLFGLDIDGRAAQLTGFALMMKGRADDRRLFNRGVKLNAMALVDSAGLDVNTIAQGLSLAEFGVQTKDLSELQRLFEYATTFGSLIKIPEELATKLSALKQLSESSSPDLFISDALKQLGPIVQQAELLATQYDAVVANPPYMGSKFYCPALKDLVNAAYKAGKPDLYCAFTLRNIQLAKENGHIGMITIPNWMFLSSFEQLRRAIIQKAPISSLVHNGRGVWGSDFGSCSYVLRRSYPRELGGRFLRLFDKQGSVASNEELERRFHSNPRFSTPNAEFERIPGIPIAYWVSDGVRTIFEKSGRLGDFSEARQGLSTADNDRFVRIWHEVSSDKAGFGLGSRSEAQQTKKMWFPLNKGGAFRKWFGNQEFVVNWRDDGEELHNFRPRSVLRNADYYFKPSVSWSDITISHNSFREYEAGFIHSNVGHSAFGGDADWRCSLLAYCNSKFVSLAAKLLSPTVHFDVGYFNSLPYANAAWTNDTRRIAKACVHFARQDWDAFERSWGFQSFPILTVASNSSPTLESSYETWITQNRITIDEMKRFEEENNRLFIDAYGLQDELTPEVPIEQITLTVNPAYRYGIKISEAEREGRFQSDTIAELASYSIGCMMGRYSLDEPGLVYAHNHNEGFAPSSYTTFPADDDGIVPLTDREWFKDDATNRFREFIQVAWSDEHLHQNLDFVAESLCLNAIKPKKSETSLETIRRYLSTQFYKDHLQTYKKRPIYWLFSSGKQKSFECLVYLHRYNEGTLSRMRTEYVTPLLGKYDAYAEQISEQVVGATTTAETNRLKKELSALEKKQNELREFDDKLKHYADMRISLDLDDGVKVNYGKFGDLLAEVKAITGKAPSKD